MPRSTDLPVTVADDSWTVGITGAPGAGKSTLTNHLVGHLRDAGERVAVLAIDPSSPFTGGAILGDRVRMQRHDTDPDVFIRSMATRGHLGGLSRATPQAVRVLAAAGYGWVVVETVGVGQVEVEVAGAADTTVVVVNPGWGDGVQAAKAGLLEIGDVFVVNKADRDGVDATVRDLPVDARAGGPAPVGPADPRDRRHRGSGCRRAPRRARCPPPASRRLGRARTTPRTAHYGRTEGTRA